MEKVNYFFKIGKSQLLIQNGETDRPDPQLRKLPVIATHMEINKQMVYPCVALLTWDTRVDCCCSNTSKGVLSVMSKVVRSRSNKKKSAKFA